MVPNVRQYLDRIYLPARPGLAPGSVQQLRIATNSFRRYSGRVQISRLRDRHVAAMMAGCLSAGNSEATVNSKHRAVLTLWGHAYRKGYTKTQPRDVPKLREPLRIPEAWTIAEVERIVARCRMLDGNVAGIPRAHWWTSLVVAVYWTGCRISALLSTKTADCSLGGRYLMVRAARQKQRQDQLWHLPDQAVAAIASHYDASRVLVWPWPHHRQTLWKHFRRIVSDAGVPASSGHCDLFHRLRRTSISYAAAVDLDLARSHAGHSTASTTIRHYVDPRITRNRSAADVLPRLCI